jgi:hypothetical protein
MMLPGGWLTLMVALAPAEADEVGAPPVEFEELLAEGAPLADGVPLEDGVPLDAGVPLPDGVLVAGVDPLLDGVPLPPGAELALVVPPSAVNAAAASVDER